MDNTSPVPARPHPDPDSAGNGHLNGDPDPAEQAAIRMSANGGYCHFVSGKTGKVQEFRDGKPGTILDWALTLRGYGYWAHLIHPNRPEWKPGEKSSKRPIGKGWGLIPWDEPKLRLTFKTYPGAGVGVGLGPERAPGGGWLIDLEGDGPEAIDSLTTLLGGEVPQTPSWGSFRGGHWLFDAFGDVLLDCLVAAGAKEGTGIRAGVWHLPELPGLEFRIGGRFPDGTTKQVQSVVPPTIGDDGNPRTWSVMPDTELASLPQAAYALLESIAERKAIQAEAAIVAPAVGPQNGHHANGNGFPSMTVRTGTGGISVEERAVLYLEKCPPAISGQVGHTKAFNAARKVGPGFDLAPDVAFRLMWDHYNPRCEPPWSEQELRHKVDEGYKVEARRGWLKDAPLKNGRSGAGGNGNGNGHAGGNAVPGGDPLTGRLALLNGTDLGNAKRLVARFGQDIRYCHPWSQWLAWDGRRWALDNTAAVARMAKKTVMLIPAELGFIPDKEERQHRIKWYFASESRKLINAMMGLAESEEGVPILHEEMNRDGWLFNVQNGTIDLRTGKLREHRREDLITQLCPIEFNPDAKCPLWEQTVDLFLGGDDALIRYWQKICGYCMVGVIRDHVMPIAWGKGSNGKSTILGTLLEVFGRDYAMKCPPDMLMAKKTDSHPTDRTDLFGKRLVVAIETEAGRRLNETLVKELTGGDAIRARRMRENFWEFLPTHTLLMATNHKPRIRGNDYGIWRRLKLIPFNVTMKGNQADLGMPAKLRAEFPGILAWCVRGCLEWQKAGELAEPESVQKATSEYRAEQDRIGAFLEERTEADPQNKVGARELYTSYRSWCDQAGETALSEVLFAAEMEERGFRKKTSNGVKYLGIALKPLPSSTSADY